ncbi:Late embryogenesis abundant protein, LEA-14 [Gossypium australe]|uniref:Late embryogenesis abundant protein, LEA-14 n=1 Tax=Gossypium australe TaxID=47621 RepID=A0A5B6VJF8_9ROSI|nr:Late embryogenesis abundant protein, LEA-14 [Gossypium australe]
MSREPSEQPKKRGRPNHSLTDNKKNKRIMDQKARQKNRDIVVELTKAAPILKQLLEAFSSTDVGACLQTVGNIQDAIARWNGGVQWQQDSMPCIQEIKDAMSEAVSKVVLPLRNDLQNVMQTMSPAFPEPDGGLFDFNLLDGSLLGPPLGEGPGTNIMCLTSICDENGEKFDDKQVTKFLQECDGNIKRKVQYSDFNGLQEELNKVEHDCFPSSLDPIIQKIKDTHGDITENSKLSNCAAHPTLVMFYTTIREMNEVKEVKDFNISKLKVWRDAICDALQINMKVEFAKQHLTKIAYAYFASKTIDQEIYDEKKRLEEKLGRISTKIELHKKCQYEAIFFNDKPLNTGLCP